MYAVAKTIRVSCLLAVIATLGGCKKPAEQPGKPGEKPGDQQPTATQPVVVEKPSLFWRHRRQAIDRRINQLQNPTPWRQITLTALREATEAYDKHLTDPMTHMKAGDKALANGQAELSIDCFRRAVALAPKNPDPHRGLAVAISTHAARQASISKSRRLYRRAAEVYRDILKLRPDDETARFNLGLAMMRSGGTTEAEEVFRPLLKSQKFATEATFNIAVILSSQGKLDQAEELLRRLIRTNETMNDSALASAYAHLGQVLVDLKDNKGALDAYKESARLTPNDVAAWLNLATVARAAGSYGYAVTATRKAAKLTPFNSEIHLRLGNVLLELHRATGDEKFLNEAVEAWRDSLKLEPSQTSLQRRVDIYSRKTPATQPATEQ
ncbi:MAG: tetratricopeptide repeat protein [Phycisphaerales bacterium]|jgi:tetratricopeptide (TPR) repeat protein|nr:tetratricopeptide repeat protein [Phycisphaerales bacterium]